MTEPKRISAIKGANTFASDMDVELGNEIGYRIRLESRTTAMTRVQFITEGIFLQEISNKPNLDNYAVVILDEVHERSLNMDIILAMLKFINPAKTRVILMSATIDTVKFSKYFFNAPVISVEGVPQTIHTFYATKAPEDRLEYAVLKAIELCDGDIPGDIIVFVDGALTAEALCRRFNELIDNSTAFCVTLYADLSAEKQDFATNVQEPGKRKVIFSTNLAEASVTINTAVFVIDTGIHKESSFEVSTRASILEIKFISKASANQRRGRVGRVGTGYVYRTYTEDEYKSMPDYTVPEILRDNLEDIVVKILGMMSNYQGRNISGGETNNKLNIEFIDAPPKKFISEAMSVLEKEKLALGKDLEDGELSPLGTVVSKFPITHQQARALVLSYRYNMSNQLMAIVSMLSIKSPFIKVDKERKNVVFNIWKSFNSYRNKFYGDQFGLLNVFDEFKKLTQNDRRKWCHDNFISCLQMDTVVQTYLDLRDMMEKRRIKSESKQSNDPKAIGRCLLEGFFLNIAVRSGNSYVMVYSDVNARLDSNSILNATKPKYILYTGLSKANNVYYMSGCYEVDLKELLEVSPKSMEEVKKILKKYGLKQ